MNQRDITELISGRSRGVGPSFKRFVLWWASMYYLLGVLARLLFYRLGVLGRHAVGKPVVCVGNLTAGGTGKTPCVAAVVNLLKRHRPAIVSRGYRADAGGNDELRVLKELCPDTPHVQNKDRVAGARKAIADGAGVVVLDDGFSHLRLRRDLDIVLVDSLNPYGYGFLLPRGLQREPRFSLRRAHVIVLTRADVVDAQRLRDLEDSVRCTGFRGPVLHAAHVPAKVVDLQSGEEHAPRWLKDKQVTPFCGIGNPEGFERTLRALGAKVTPLGALPLGDHAALNEQAWSRQIIPFLRASMESGSQLGICTQKDAVKMRQGKLPDAGIPVYELRVDFKFLRGEDELKKQLDALFEGSKADG